MLKSGREMREVGRRGEGHQIRRWARVGPATISPKFRAPAVRASRPNGAKVTTLSCFGEFLLAVSVP